MIDVQIIIQQPATTGGHMSRLIVVNGEAVCEVVPSWDRGKLLADFIKESILAALEIVGMESFEK